MIYSFCSKWGSVTDPAISLPKIGWVVISTREMSGECELYLDVDCSGLSYESRPSASVLRAVEDLQRQQQQLSTTTVQQDFGRTESYQESLATSLLSRLDGNRNSEAELTEAFCRDVDSFSFEFERQEAPPSGAAPQRPQAPRRNSNKPPLCAEVLTSQ